LLVVLSSKVNMSVATAIITHVSLRTFISTTETGLPDMKTDLHRQLLLDADSDVR
jgi:hypothetical protein